MSQIFLMMSKMCVILSKIRHDDTKFVMKSKIRHGDKKFVMTSKIHNDIK